MTKLEQTRLPGSPQQAQAQMASQATAGVTGAAQEASAQPNGDERSNYSDGFRYDYDDSDGDPV